ncbi:MAG: cytochrome P460 family protein [Terracidiphilus sp.]
MRTFGKVIVAGILVFAALQLVRPTIPSRPATAEVQAPPEVRHILEKDCYSCHSDQRRLAWFDQIVPAYWLVRRDILTAREHLNFSTLGSKPPAAQKAALYEAVNMVQLGAMPLPSFRKLHPEAVVTPEELATLKAYLAPWAQIPIRAAAPTQGSTAVAEIAPAVLAAQAEFNGFPFDAGFEGWKVISITDRGDNNTFRFVLGNDIAFKAAQTGNISPWPDGAQFAKIAWSQKPGADGLMHPGAFVQVELMLKGARRYRDTDGWGWGRWRGLSLKRYGADAHFVNECTGCHEPVSGNDYVYTLPITAARVDRDEVVNNRAAAVPPSLPYDPLKWRPITIYVDSRNRTMATLFGNDIAMQAVNARSDAAPAYQAGSVLALVTWAQRDDPHWFGARLSDSPQSVEFIQVAAGKKNMYRQFAAPELNEIQPNADTAARRTNFVLGLAPARLP